MSCLRYRLRKGRNLLSVMLCLGMMLLAGKVDYARAAELPADSAAVDTRPDYAVYVNRALNCITVKQKNADGSMTPVKAMVCSCGSPESATPEGTFQTSDYYVWRRMVDDTFGRYAVRFHGKILFHSVPYIKKAPDSLKWEEYNKLGENASLGCVRLSTEDAKWIYDNCKPGTTVVVYSDTENVGELGKPSAVKIDADSPNRTWDPTDITAGNPWNGEAVTAVTPFSGTVEEFDYAAYADRYPDVREAFGYDRDALYNHYITYGINEGRVAQSIHIE